jgi:DNA ligase (NAD+)
MADLYRLSVDDFFVIPQTKEKMANKLYSHIQKSKHLPLASFLNGLGIEGAGQTTWEKLLEVYPSIEKLTQATPSDIAEIEARTSRARTKYLSE